MNHELYIGVNDTYNISNVAPILKNNHSAFSVGALKAIAANRHQRAILVANKKKSICILFLISMSSMHIPNDIAIRKVRNIIEGTVSITAIISQVYISIQFMYLIYNFFHKNTSKKLTLNLNIVSYIKIL